MYLKFVILFFVIFFNPSLFAATDDCTSTADGNFSDGANWTCGHQPDKDDNVTINHDIILDVSFTGGGKISGNWTIAAGKSLVGAGQSLEFGGTTTTINGTLSINNLTINNGAAITFGAASAITVAGDFTNNNNSNTVTVNTSNFAVAGNLTNGTGGTITGAGQIDVTGTVTNDGTGTLFSCTGAACCAGGCVLAIELAEFKVAQINGERLLSWSTFSETNNDFFVVEQSYNGFEYFPIGYVNGSGNSSELKKYEFIHRGEGSECYYRIVDVDFSGIRTVHSGVFVRNKDGQGVELVQQGDGLVFSGYDNERALDCIITNQLGSTVTSVTLPKSTDQSLVSITDLNPGVYIAVLRTDSEVIFTKVFVK